jgi:hypothetical protein
VKRGCYDSRRTEVIVTLGKIMATPQDEWIQNPLIGVSPECFKRHESGSSGQKAEAKHVPSSAQMEVPFEKNATMRSEKITFGYVDVVFKLSLQVKAKLDLSGGEAEGESEGASTETTLTPLGYDAGALAQRVAHAWMDKGGVRILGFHTGFTELKLEGGIKIQDGFQVVVTGSGKLPCGVELKLEVTAININKKWRSKGPGVALIGEIPWFPFNVEPIKGVRLNEVQLHPIVALEFELNYEKIGKDAVKKFALESAGEEAAETAAEAGEAMLSFDAAIIGGLLLAGTATIGAAILTISDGNAIAETGGHTRALAAKLTEGFRIGAEGGSAPGDSAMIPGYTLGIKNYDAAYIAVQSKSPGAGPEAIKKAIAAQVPKAVDKIAPTILKMAQDTVWDHYASEHEDSFFHSYEYDRWVAWHNIYQEDPHGCALYVKYMNDHSSRTHGM